VKKYAYFVAVLAALVAAAYASDDCGGIQNLEAALSGAECDVTATITATDDCGNSTVIGRKHRAAGKGGPA